VVDAAAVSVMSSEMTGRLQQEVMLRKVVLVILVFFLVFYTYSNRPLHEAEKSVQHIASCQYPILRYQLIRLVSWGTGLASGVPSGE
jgi:hypothetical protein